MVLISKCLINERTKFAYQENIVGSQKNQWHLPFWGSQWLHGLHAWTIISKGKRKMTFWEPKQLCFPNPKSSKEIWSCNLHIFSSKIQYPMSFIDEYVYNFANFQTCFNLSLTNPLNISPIRIENFITIVDIILALKTPRIFCLIQSNRH